MILCKFFKPLLFFTMICSLFVCVTITQGFTSNSLQKEQKEIETVKVIPIKTVMQTCEEFKKSIAHIVQSETIVIPMDDLQNQNKKINLTYFLASDFKSNAKSTTLLLQMDLGESSWNSMIEALNQNKAITRNFVALDMRGTGCSKGQVHKDHFANVWSIWSAIEDLEALRKKLLGSNGKWNIIAAQFGSLIAQKYMKKYPHAIKEINWIDKEFLTNWEDKLFIDLQNQKNNLKRYLLKFPKDENLIHQIKNSVPENLCFDNDNLKICGPNLINTSLIYINDESMWENLHQLLPTLMNGQTLNRKKFDRWISNMLFLYYGIADSVYEIQFIKSVRGVTKNNDFWGCQNEKIVQTFASELLNECHILQNISRSESEILNLKLQLD